MNWFLNDKLKWYGKNLNQYFLDTIYDTDKLMVELPQEKWFKINPTRGMKKAICCYDLARTHSKISDFLINVYGETEYNRATIDRKTMRFSRRNVAAGGGLYPNLIYILIKTNKVVNIYQFDPALCVLRVIDRVAAVESEFEENKCYFISTLYYFRNWLKYRYFGYRLMNVDSGYLLASFYSQVIKSRLDGEICLSSKLFNLAKEYIKIDLKKENICFVVKINDINLLDSIKNLNKVCKYQIFDDWDTLGIDLYETIEKAALDQQYDICEKIVGDLKFDIFNSKKIERNRISPGGAAMQSILPINKDLLLNTIHTLNILIKDVEYLICDLNIYIYIKKIEGFEVGIYRLSLEKDGGLEFVRLVYEDLQVILKKHNFNFDQTPALIFVGNNPCFDFSKCLESEFKFVQLKVGFLSHLISVAAAFNDCYTHPILGFDSKLCEKKIGEKNILNLIAFSDAKTVDRQRLSYRKDET